MKLFFALFIAFCSACITPFACHSFAYQLNQQVKQNYIALFKTATHTQQGLAAKSPSLLGLFTYPIILMSFVFCIDIPFLHFVLLTFIITLLIYLSLLDCAYYLTDVRLVFILFLFNLTEALFFNILFLEERIFSLFITLVFFSIFPIMIKFCLKKEGFGSGDVILLYALAPLFSPIQMLHLLLYSSLAACFYAFLWRWRYQQKIEKIPFIPFITFASWLLIIHSYC